MNRIDELSQAMCESISCQLDESFCPFCLVYQLAEEARSQEKEVAVWRRMAGDIASIPIRDQVSAILGVCGKEADE